MKFTVDVSDFYLDEESELEPALKAHLIHQIISKITKEIEEKVQKEVSIKALQLVADRLSSVIDNKLDEMVATGVITVSGKQVSIVDHIKTVFENSHGWSNPSKQIQEFAKKFGESMKAQYNVVFANQIVVSMKEQGFLKDEVVNLLLTEKK
jgi:hypothetical protein